MTWALASARLVAPAFDARCRQASPSPAFCRFSSTTSRATRFSATKRTRLPCAISSAGARCVASIEGFAIRLIGDRQACFSGQGAEDRVLREAAEGVIDLIDHGELREGEDVDHRAVFLDEPAGLLGDDLADRFEERIEAGMQRLAFGVFELWETDAVLDLQQVGQRGVHLDRK